MKNLVITVIFSLFVVGFSQAQVQKVSVGTSLFNFGTVNINDIGKKPMTQITSLVLGANASTKKSYHLVTYGVGNNAVGTLHGLFLKNGYDTYVRYGHGLSDKSNTIAVGFEKFLPIANLEKTSVNAFLFTEISTDFRQGNYVTVGLIINASVVAWKRK